MAKRSKEARMRRCPPVRTKKSCSEGSIGAQVKFE